MRVLLAAGEVSGDMYGAALARELKALTEVELAGMGGQMMEEAGVDIRFNPLEMSTVGFSEVVGNLRQMYAGLRRLGDFISDWHPDLVVPIDFPGFNLKLARRAQAHGIPVLYYIPPAAWAWGGRWRARRVLARVDRLAAIFPFEADFYRDVACRDNEDAVVDFVGHPLVDRLAAYQFVEDPLSALDIVPDSFRLALLPGSRRAEVLRLLPEMARAVSILNGRIPGLECLLPCADTISPGFVRGILKEEGLGDQVKVTRGMTYDILKVADYALVTSGTATLEAACLLTPMVIIYRASIVTRILGRMLLRIPHIGLPNIIAGEEIVPELVQDEVDPERLAEYIWRFYSRSGEKKQKEESLRAVREELGSPGAVRRAAELVLETAAWKGVFR